jgi:hypothetical protein
VRRTPRCCCGRLEHTQRRRARLCVRPRHGATVEHTADVQRSRNTPAGRSRARSFSAGGARRVVRENRTADVASATFRGCSCRARALREEHASHGFTAGPSRFVESRAMPPIEHPNDAIVRVTSASIRGSDSPPLSRGHAGYARRHDLRARSRTLALRGKPDNRAEGPSRGNSRIMKHARAIGLVGHALLLGAAWAGCANQPSTESIPPSPANTAQAPESAPHLAGKRAPCTLGQDQTCNADPKVSALWGTCLETGVCECHAGFELNPMGTCAPVQ